MSKSKQLARAYESALVLGLGSSGMAAADLLLGEGTAVTAVDSADSAELRNAADKLKAAGARVMLGCKKLPGGEFSVCVLSPGIDSSSDWVRGIEKRRVPVVPELELGWLRCSCRILAVTGSNGKSTFVKLCRDSLVKAGLRAEPAGNYGMPLCTAARMSAQLDWVVVEVSSFQLEKTDQFRPDVGVLLNIVPNHLDRHHDMETYAALKRRLFARMIDKDTAVAPVELAGAISALPGFRGKLVTFGSSDAADCVYGKSQVTAGAPGKRHSISLAGTMFDNDVLGPAAAAAVGAVEACGLPGDCVGAAAAAFKPLAHRMQRVAERDGVLFVDDSKGTNLAAMGAALRLAQRPVRLIAGGLLKEKKLDTVKELLEEKAVAVYLIGAGASAMEKAWHDVVPCLVCGGIDEAVKTAWNDAREGDMVLLSPGCASFDQFRNFEQRGERFAEIVAGLDCRREAVCAQA